MEICKAFLKTKGSSRDPFHLINNSFARKAMVEREQENKSQEDR